MWAADSSHACQPGGAPRQLGRCLSCPTSVSAFQAPFAHCPAAALPLPSGDFTAPEEISQLLRAAGAKQLSRPPAAQPAPRAAAGPCTSFLLAELPDGAGSPAAAPLPPPPSEQAGGDGDGAGSKSAAAAAPGSSLSLVAPPAIAEAKWYQRAREGGVPVVSHRWLLDSISWYTPQPLERYRL